MQPEEVRTRKSDDLNVERDLWWTALVILMTTGDKPKSKKTKIRRTDI